MENLTGHMHHHRMPPGRSPSSVASHRLTRTEANVLVILTVVALVIRGAWFGDPNADTDEQLYSLIGLEMTNGTLPFVGLWDRKPIGLFVLFAFAHTVGGPEPLSYQLLAAAFVVAGAFMTYRLALRLVDPMTSLGAAVLFTLLISFYGGHSANSEVFFVPMMLGMAILVWNIEHPQASKRSWIAMLIGGLALQVKYTVLPQCLFFGLWALWGRYCSGTSIPTLFKLALGFALVGIAPTVIVGLGYAAAGYWEEFVFANFISFFERLPSETGRISRYHLAFLIPLIVLLFAAAYAAIRLRPPRNRRIYLFFSLWIMATLTTIYLPATVYLYYYASLAAVVPLFALPILDRKGGAGPFPLIFILAAFAYLQFLPASYATADRHIERMDKLAAAITPLVDSERNCLYVFDGPTALYRASGSCLPTRFIYPDHLNNAYERDSLGISQTSEIARILARRPPVIVTADTAFTPQNEQAKRLVDIAVQEDYQEIATESLHGRNIRVWALREISRD